MAGDFLSDDELSDISDDEGGKRRKSKRNDLKKGKEAKRRKREGSANPEELSDSDDDEAGKDEDEVRFTSEGLVYVNKKGEVTGKVGDDEKDGPAEDEEESDEDTEDGSGSEDGSDGGDSGDEGGTTELEVGTKVEANYHASDQYGGKRTWYPGEVTAVHKFSGAGGGTTYDVTYDDGDVEEDVAAENVRALPGREGGDEEEESEEDDGEEEDGEKSEKARKIKAKIRAR